MNSLTPRDVLAYQGRNKKVCDTDEFYPGSELVFTLPAPKGKEKAHGNEIIIRENGHILLNSANP